MKRDLITIDQLSNDDLAEIYQFARVAPVGDEYAGKGVALVFEHPSLRTRASSVTAVQMLGGRLVQLTGAEVGLDTRECAEDVARTLLATSDVAALRVRDHGVFARMSSATGGRLRLINLLSDLDHPTQAIADVLTLADALVDGNVDDLAGRRVSYVGDATNVTRSLASALVRLGVHVTVAAPEGYRLPASDVALINALSRRDGRLEVLSDPVVAVTRADAVYTDVWISMGLENEADQRRRDLVSYRVDDALMAHAPNSAYVMHCLPAHRGEEITSDVLDSERTLIWEQVRHRTSAMLGVLQWMRSAIA